MVSEVASRESADSIFARIGVQVLAVLSPKDWEPSIIHVERAFVVSAVEVVIEALILLLTPAPLF